MIRMILLIGVLLLSTRSSFSQKIILSEKEELSLRNDDFMVVGKCRSYISVYRNHGDVGEIIFYNKDFVKEKISTLSFLPGTMTKIFFSCTANQMNAFYVVRENKQYKVFVSSLQEDYSWKEPILLDQTPSGAYRSSQEWNFVHSEDQSNTLLYTSFVENDKTITHAKVVDADMNVISTVSEALLDNEMTMTEQAVVSNDGMAFITLNRNKNTKGGANALMVLQILKGNAGLAYRNFDLKEYSVSDIHLAIDQVNQNLVVCGYFADGRFSAPRGLYLGNFSLQTLTLQGAYFTPLALQISSLHTDLKDLKIRNLSLTKSGQVEVAAEKYVQSIRNITSPAPLISTGYTINNMAENARTVHEFLYDEIVLFHLKTDGSLAWSQTILKDQTTYDDNGIFSSFGILQHRLGNAFIFNDMSGKQSRLLASYVSGNGELTVKELQTSNEVDDWNLMPRSAVQISSSEIVMPCVSKSYLCFLKISY